MLHCFFFTALITIVTLFFFINQKKFTFTCLLIPYIVLSENVLFYDPCKKRIRRGGKMTALFDRRGHGTLNFICLSFIFHSQININCKKCIIVVILISSQQTCRLLRIQTGKPWKNLSQNGEKQGLKGQIFHR